MVGKTARRTRGSPGRISDCRSKKPKVRDFLNTFRAKRQPCKRPCHIRQSDFKPWASSLRVFLPGMFPGCDRETANVTKSVRGKSYRISLKIYIHLCRWSASGSNIVIRITGDTKVTTVNKNVEFVKKTTELAQILSPHKVI